MATVAQPFDALPLPRRVAIGDLLRTALALEQRLAALYATFGARAGPRPLAAAVAELAETRGFQLAHLESLIGALAANGGGARPAAEATPALPEPLARPAFFAGAFTAERDVELVYRELLALFEPTGPPPALAELATRAARRRRQLRDIYLRYS